MVSSIVVSPNPLLLQPDQEGDVNVVYVTGQPTPWSEFPFIWEKTDGDDWQRVDLASRLISEGEDEELTGIFLKRLRGGQAYQVLMYHLEDADPNSAIGDPVEPLARDSATAWRIGPPESDLIGPAEPGPTGTSFGWYPHTTRPTSAVLEVSNTPPETVTIAGQPFKRFASRIGRDHSNGLSGSHSLEVASEALLPGNAFHALLLVIDEHGAWQQRDTPFTTKERRVEISFEEVWVINDGAEIRNTAEFRVWVVEGPKIVGTVTVPEREIWDQGAAVDRALEYIPLGGFIPGPVVLGPKPIDDGSDEHARNKTVAIVTRGIAGVTVGTNDISGNFLPGHPASDFPDEFRGTIFPGAYLRFPIGREREVLENSRFAVTATPLSADNEFQYQVRGRYSVTYH